MHGNARRSTVGADFLSKLSNQRWTTLELKGIQNGSFSRRSVSIQSVCQRFLGAQKENPLLSALPERPCFCDQHRL